MPTCTTVIKTLFLITVTGLLDTHCANIWTSWSRCSVTCGIRIGQETRICTSVMYGRHACDPRGLVERRDCHVKKARPCPGAVGPFEGVEELKPSEWDTWSQWTPCSVTCGAGNRTRERTCVIKDERVFTAKCPGAGVDSTPCLLSTCPNTVGEAGKKGGKVTWTDWGLWSSCIGSRTRHRSCPATGRRATCEGSSDEREDCGETCTTVGEGSAPAGEDGWYPWSPWGQCSVTCGEGVKSRERQCQDTDKCQGDTQESSTCENDPCGGYTNGWSNWSPWEQCPVTCGKGVTRRGRDCHNPENIREWCIGQAEETKTCVADQLCPGMTMINEAHVTSRVGARIRCMVDWFIDSHPSATVNWLKDNQYLPMFSGRKLMEYGDLEIDIVEKDDSGIYACSVTKDGVDVITNVVLLKVDEAPLDQNTVYGNGSINFFSFDVAAPLSLPLLSLTFVIGATIGQYIGNRSNPDADEDPEEASSASRSRKSRQKGGKGKDAGKKKPGKGKKKGKGKSKKREVEENASDDGSGSGYSEELNREEEVAFAPSYYEDDLYDEGVPYEQDWAAPAGDAPPAPPPPGEGPPPPPGPPPGDGGMPPPPPPPPP